jgi:hypothetical protein
MMINPTDKGEERQERPNRLHSKGLSHTGRRRNYKLIVDPEIHGKQYEKQYRFDGHTKGVRGPHLARETPIVHKLEFMS